MDGDSVVGRAPEHLTPVERTALAGKWIAMEVYSPQTLPQRKIEAVGDSARACARQLAARGLDPNRFEYTIVLPAW